MHQAKDEQGRFTSPNLEPLADKALSVRVPVSLDQVVRSLPNRPEWLRDAVIEKAEREGLIQQRSDTAEMSLEDLN